MRPEGRARGGALRCALVALAVLTALLGAGRATGEEEVLPPEYAGRRSPLAADPQAPERGHRLFVDNCAPCHGEAGDGRGPASVGLRPPPADLAGPAIVPARSDAYLFYRLTVGKRGSAMPAFGTSLSETERWEIVAYLRRLASRSASPGT